MLSSAFRSALPMMPLSRTVITNPPLPAFVLHFLQNVRPRERSYTTILDPAVTLDVSVRPGSVSMSPGHVDPEEHHRPAQDHVGRQDSPRNATPATAPTRVMRYW
jgi:hypothetical protein